MKAQKSPREAGGLIWRSSVIHLAPDDYQQRLARTLKDTQALLRLASLEDSDAGSVEA